MAISALVAVEPIADELIEKIKDRMGKLVTGDGTRGCDMGPLVTAPHRDKVAGYVDAGVEEGATLVVDGREDEFDGGGDGYFLGPDAVRQRRAGHVDLPATRSSARCCRSSACSPTTTA